MDDSPVGTCRLCLQKASLKNSHILPEFLYVPGYDVKHRAAKRTIEPRVRGHIQKGFREKLLCGPCEQRIGRFDKYFADIWYNDRSDLRFPQHIDDDVVRIPGLDYHRFKLFHLSVLWRAAVSISPFFAGVQLGDRHTERLRRCLCEKNAGPEDRYTFFALVLVDGPENAVVHGALMEPIPSKYKGHHVYVFIFGGCAWHYFVSSHATGFPWRFSRAGELVLAKQDFYTFQPVRDFARGYARNLLKAE